MMSPPQYNAAAGPTKAVAMQGTMKKKKSSTPSILRPITLDWTTRYFILYENGTMVYSRNGPSVQPKDTVVICTNITACQIDRADLGPKKSHVANGFYITVAEGDESAWSKSHGRTLFVTNGPAEFKKWIRAFQRMKATINFETGDLSTMDHDDPSIIPKDIPSIVSSEHSLKVSALGMQDNKFQDAGAFDEKAHVSFSMKDEIILLGEIAEEEDSRPVVKRGKSVSFDETSLGEVIPGAEVGSAEDAPGGLHSSESEKSRAVKFDHDLCKLCEGAKIFAHGDTLEELAEALTGDEVLYGVVTTTLEEAMGDDSRDNSMPQPYPSKMMVFSIVSHGTNDGPVKSERLEQHVGNFISYCQASTNFDKLHPIRCNDGTNFKDQIMAVLQALDGYDEKDVEKLTRERLRQCETTGDSVKQLREERRSRWSKMNVSDILKDLGRKESLPGWVLLCIDF